MAIYIPNRNVPARCGMCWAADAFDCHMTGQFIHDHGIRSSDCELMQVEHHGDLIDRDFIIDRLQQQIASAGEHSEIAERNRSFINMLKALSPVILAGE